MRTPVLAEAAVDVAGLANVEQDTGGIVDAVDHRDMVARPAAWLGVNADAVDPAV